MPNWKSETCVVAATLLLLVSDCLAWCDVKHEGDCLLGVRGSLQKHVEKSAQHGRGMEFFDHNYSPFGKIAAVPKSAETGLAEIRFEIDDIDTGIAEENVDGSSNETMEASIGDGHQGRAVLSANGTFSVTSGSSNAAMSCQQDNNHSPSLHLQSAGDLWSITHSSKLHTLQFHSGIAENKRIPFSLDFEAPSDSIVITEVGDVGIGNPWPSVRLDVSGGVQGTSAYSSASDRRFKKNVEPIGSETSTNLDLLKRLTGVKFDWRQDEFPTRGFPDYRQIGFIAQDVEKVIPEVVRTNLDGYKAIEYSSLVPVLVEALKESQRASDRVQSRLEQRIELLEQKIEQLLSVSLAGIE